MIHLRFIIIALLIVFSLLSVHASNHVGVSKEVESAVSFTSVKLDHWQRISSTQVEFLSPLAPVLVESTKHIASHPKESGFEPVQFRLALSNSSLFLHQVQVEPNYTPIFEFFKASLARELYLKPLEPPITRPWYTAYEGKKTRLSGWKDANLLYRSVNTYHS
ncbi:hypothetical protein [Pseudoalteromonas sp. H105]|uniref:hypothetical protein n=1 Tax=Pseudoalteromonas sp. H105 TaxID=1348393 RepID=UPI000731FECD|nr:hypothetical protein [Pseudoalteromonas sp. H105]KTF18472.1 hypothetical protein ATS75_03430 [Pseudoalteromonas sp. H105]